MHPKQGHMVEIPPCSFKNKTNRYKLIQFFQIIFINLLCLMLMKIKNLYRALYRRQIFVQVLAFVDVLVWLPTMLWHHQQLREMLKKNRKIITKI